MPEPIMDPITAWWRWQADAFDEFLS